MNPPIRLIVVDDDKLIAQLLYDFFDKQSAIKALAALHGGNQLIEYLQTTEELPDIVVLDLRMSDGDGLETAAVLKRDFSSIKVIALSSHYQLSYTGHLFKLGFSAFLPKSTDTDELLAHVYTVYKKGFYLSEEQVLALREQVSSKSPTLVLDIKDTLSEREKEVLRLLCQQYTAKEIAEKMFISARTVETHKSNLLLKTGVKNTAGLVIYAVRNNLIGSDDFPIL